MTAAAFTPFDRIIAALRRHGSTMHATKRGFDAQCPAHDDRRPSLSVDPGIDKHGLDTVFLKCRSAECSTSDICAALGLRESDLFTPRETAPRNGFTILETYPYRAPDGTERFQRLRMLGDGKRDKGFIYRHRGPNGKWVYKRPPNVPKTLFRLPELIDGVAHGEHIFICEGEKDANRLAALGKVATTTEDGASPPSWLSEYNPLLAGANVTVIADYDKAGYNHARHTVALLTGVAKSVRLVRGKLDTPKSDVSDHLDAGFTLDQLIPVPTIGSNGHRAGPVELESHSDDNPPMRRLQPVYASEVIMRRTRWLWENRIPLGGLTLLAGREGLGKSTLAVELTAQVTRGDLMGESHGIPGVVVYIHSEDARDFTIVPRLVAAGADLTRVIFLNALNPDDTATSIVLPFDTELLAEAVMEHNAVMVVLDAATSVIDGKLDGDKDRQMRQALEAIATKVGERTGCAVLGIVHFGKRESSDTGKLILGSIAWSQVARSTLAIALDSDTGRLVLTGSKSNLAPMDTSSLALQIEPATVDTPEGPTSVGKVTWLGDTDDDARDLLDGGEGASDRSERNEARDWLRDYLGQGRVKSSDAKRAANAAGISERTLTRARGSLKVKISAEGFPRVTYWSLPAWPDSGASAATGLARTGERGGPTVSTAADQHIYSGPTSGPTGGPTGEWPDSAPTSGATGLTAGPGSYASGDSGAMRVPAREADTETRARKVGWGHDSELEHSGPPEGTDEPHTEPGDPCPAGSLRGSPRLDTDSDSGTTDRGGDGRPGSSARDATDSSRLSGPGIGDRDAPTAGVVEGPRLECRRCGGSDSRTMHGLSICAQCAYGVPDDGGDHLDRWPVIPSAGEDE